MAAKKVSTNVGSCYSSLHRRYIPLVLGGDKVRSKWMRHMSSFLVCLLLHQTEETYSAVLHTIAKSSVRMVSMPASHEYDNPARRLSKLLQVVIFALKPSR